MSLPERVENLWRERILSGAKCFDPALTLGAQRLVRNPHDKRLKIGDRSRDIAGQRPG